MHKEADVNFHPTPHAAHRLGQNPKLSMTAPGERSAQIPSSEVPELSPALSLCLPGEWGTETETHSVFFSVKLHIPTTPSVASHVPVPLVNDLFCVLEAQMNPVQRARTSARTAGAAPLQPSRICWTHDTLTVQVFDLNTFQVAE